TSYSQLATAHATEDVPAADLLLAEASLRNDEFSPASAAEIAPEPATVTPAEPGKPHPVFTFAKGANAGTCLHAILEKSDFHDTQALETLVRQQLARYGLLVADEQEQTEQCQQVADWLQAI